MPPDTDQWLGCPYCESEDVELVQYKRPGEYVRLTVACQSCLAVGEIRVDYN